MMVFKSSPYVSGCPRSLLPKSQFLISFPVPFPVPNALSLRLLCLDQSYLRLSVSGPKCNIKLAGPLMLIQPLFPAVSPMFGRLANP